MVKTEDILKNLLLPDNDDWEIESVSCNDDAEEIHVNLRYVRDDVVVDGKHHPIYDHRQLRDWRHLDLWQYKTYLSARVPRYWDEGRIVSMEVPWALPVSRLTGLMEKKR